MTYRLVVLTHGYAAPTLELAVAAFDEHVTPAPTQRILVVDGPAARADSSWDEVLTCPAQEGFCKATARAWTAAAAPGADYALYLEHDFEVSRPLDLRQLAYVLDNDPTLAQLQLMRDAVNDAEKAAGGLYESRRDQYEQHFAWSDDAPLEHPGFPFQIHSAYCSTNPSLMRTAFMRENPWPEYDPPDQCEGKFGIDLVAAGYRFGVWGSGEPWCVHAGVRDGSGHGY